MKFIFNIKKGIIILGFIIITNISLAQQEPMFTQYMFNTQVINPGYAGTWDRLGFMAVVRQQWVGFNNAPRTYSLSMQTPTKGDRVALGLNVVSDYVGREKRFMLFADYSYKIRINSQSVLNLGFKGGFSNYSNNLLAYSLGNEGDDPMFNSVIDTKFMPNFGVGLFWYSKKYYLGLSVPKIINNVYKTNGDNFASQAEMRHYYLIGGLVVKINEYLAFKPTFLVKAVSGAPVEVDLSANFLLKEKLWLGAMYRTGDSFGFIAQWIFKNKLRVGYAVDFSTTKLQNYNSGSHEIMVSYELNFLKERFISPRYF